MTRDSDIDEIYDVINELMSDNKIRVIDFIIKHIDLDNWASDEVDIALSLLTSTLPVKTQLKERGRLIGFIKWYAPENEVDELLVGLI